MVSSDLVRDASSTPQHLQSPEMELQSINESSRALAADKAEALTVLPRNKIDKHSMNFVVRSGIAGGIAGCAAKTVVGPLDRVKILFQASNPEFAKYSGSWSGLVNAMRELNRNEGLIGLFRGHSVTLLRIFPYAGIKFLAYEQYRALLIPSNDYETPLRRLLAGSLAGMTSVSFTYPLEVVRVRLAFETRRGQERANLARICRQIYHEPSFSPLPARQHATVPTVNIAETVETIAKPSAGLANFYRGFAPTLIGMLPYAGMSFLTHDLAGDALRHPLLAAYTIQPQAHVPANTTTQEQSPRPRLTNPAQLLAGAVAGLVSQTASYPLEVIRRRMQVGGAIGASAPRGMRATAWAVWMERGFKGFFVGLGIGYIKVVPMVAVSFWTYERAKSALGI